MAETSKKIYFITGASGVGKTTLLSLLENKYTEKGWLFLHFDSIGVPSVEDMNKEYGSPSRWQEAMTHQWIDKLINEYDNEKIFLEGQVNLQFIYDAFKKYQFKNFIIVLIDCDEEQMAYRLTHKRGQPELLTTDMKNWLKFLRKQAKEFGVPIINTTHLTNETVLNTFQKVAGLAK